MTFTIELASLCICIALAVSNDVLAAPTPLDLSAISRRGYDPSALDFGSAVQEYGLSAEDLLQPRSSDPDSSTSDYLAEYGNLFFGTMAGGAKEGMNVQSSPRTLTRVVQGGRQSANRRDGVNRLQSFVDGHSQFGWMSEDDDDISQPRAEMMHARDNMRNLHFGNEALLSGQMTRPSLEAAASPQEVQAREDVWDLWDLNFGGSATSHAGELKSVLSGRSGSPASNDDSDHILGLRYDVNDLQFGQTADFRRRWSWPSDDPTLSTLRFGAGGITGVLQGKN